MEEKYLQQGRGKQKEKVIFFIVLTRPAQLVAFQQVFGKSLWFSSSYQEVWKYMYPLKEKKFTQIGGALTVSLSIKEEIIEKNGGFSRHQDQSSDGKSIERQSLHSSEGQTLGFFSPPSHSPRCFESYMILYPRKSISLAMLMT